MMKKAILPALLFAAAMLAGCGETGGTGGTGSEQPPAETDSTVYVQCPAAPEAPEISEEGYTAYYFDSEKGNDANDGSQTAPKQTLAAANSLIRTARTPTEVLFQGNFSGELRITGHSASAEKPLLVRSYGTGAVIDGNGAEQAVTVTGSHLRLSGLEIVNRTGKKGIYVYTTGAFSDLVIENCNIHDVNWNWTEEESEESYSSHLDDLGVGGVSAVDPGFVYETGGIVFFTPTGSVPCYLEDVWVKDNRIERVSKSGILLSSQWVKQPGVGWGVNKYQSAEEGFYPSRNVNFVGNFVNFTGGDGIVMIGVENGFIEGNTSYHSNFLGRTGFANAGIWSIGSKHIVICRNEGAYSHLSNGGVDGQGFDIDIASTDILFAFNYSHDNDGGGLLLCNTGSVMQKYDEKGEPVIDRGKPVTEEIRGDWTDVVIRNNIFAENGKSRYYPAFANVTGSCYNCLVENNTVLFKAGIERQPFMTVALWGEQYGPADGFTFRSNILSCAEENTGALDFTNMGDDYLFVGNCIYHLSEEFLSVAADSRPFTENPMISLPQDRKGYDKIALYAPGNARCFTEGLKLSEKSRTDILGQETKGVYYFGAICAAQQG